MRIKKTTVVYLVHIIQGKKFHGLTTICIENVTYISPVFTQHWCRRSVSENFLVDKLCSQERHLVAV